MKTLKGRLASKRQRVYIASLAALASAGIATTFSATSSADTFGSSLTPVQLHDANGGCLDLPGGNTTPGTDVQIWACDSNGVNQTWFIDDDSNDLLDLGSEIHYGTDPSQCLDLPGDASVDQARIQIEPCNGSAEQRWAYEPDGTLRKFDNRTAGKCIELLDGVSTNGNIVHLFDCNGTSGQTWFPLLGNAAHPVQIHDANGGCLDLPGGNTTDGTFLQIWACDSGGLNQSWYEDAGGAIHYAANPSKCIDLPDGTQVDQARIQLWDCDNGASQDQQWISEPDHTLRKFSSGVAGKCVELLNGSASDGNIVHLFDCNGTSGQTWSAIRPAPVVITYHQVGACNGTEYTALGDDVPSTDSVGQKAAYVVFGVDSINNPGAIAFNFDPTRLYVQQSNPSQQDFFDSSLAIYSYLLGPFAVQPTTVISGQFQGNFLSYGAVRVRTTNLDGAVEANSTAYALNYAQQSTDPPVALVLSSTAQTSWPDTENCYYNPYDTAPGITLH